jgi:3-oxoacyl-[acyl-carrier-protein] synthase-3
MSVTIVEGVKLESVCACVPKNEIINKEFGKELFGDSLDNVISATGVERRRICKNKATTALELSIAAAEKIFLESGTERSEIGGIIFVTFTPKFIMPCNAAQCQDILGLNKNIPAFDINLACSGYVYGLWIASLMAGSLQTKILLLDGDKQSHLVSKDDKTTALLFSDAGSATIVSPAECSSKWYFNFYTDGSGEGALKIEDGGSLNWFSESSLDLQTDLEGNKRKRTDLYMNGLNVFKFVTLQVPKNINQLLDGAQLTSDQIDRFVFHQANLFMINQIAKSLKAPKEKVPVTIGMYGNSSSSTIPLTITGGMKEINFGKVLLSGFGAGLSIGSAIINMENTKNHGVIEYEEI